jgi:myo-inositol catabolism protein IolS
MKHYELGDTHLSVSKIALGCWGFAGGSMWGDQEDADSIATVNAALDAGINFFETAQAYGDGYSEEVLGKALVGRRHQAVVATKIRPKDISGDSIEAACEQSLRRLRTDYIDLLQPHWPNRKISAEETFRIFSKLRGAGKIRAFGVSNYGVGDLAKILPYGDVASDQLPYSLLFRAIEYEVQPLCLAENVSILCYSTLLHGLLTGKYRQAADVPQGRARTRHFSSSRAQTRHGEGGCEREVFTAIEQLRQIAVDIGHPMSLVSVSWVLHQPGVASVLVGARKAEQISQMTTAVDIHLDDQTIKQILGPNPDMWMSESRFR